MYLLAMGELLLLRQQAKEENSLLTIRVKKNKKKGAWHVFS
jgi:hypothetical protein